MNPRIIAALVLLLAVVVGVVLISNGDDSDEGSAPTQTAATPTADASAAPTTVTVNYTENGFEPSEVTIDAGQSVMFVNDSSQSLIVASDPHPTHTDLGGFESGTLGQGASYLFVFNEQGTWGFHNHLNTSNTGRVIVQ